MATAFYNDLEMAELGPSSPPPNNQNSQPVKSRLQIMLEEQQKAEDFMAKFVDVSKQEIPQHKPQEEASVKPNQVSEFTEIVFSQEAASQPETVIETFQAQTARFASHGELSFQTQTGLPVEKNQVPDIPKTEAKTGTDKKTSFKIPEPLEKVSEVMFNFGHKVGKEVHKNGKEFFGAMVKLFKENVFYASKKKETDPKKAKEEAEKKAKRAAHLREFFTKLKENLHISIIKKQEEEINLEKRLGTAGLSLGEKNRFMGKNRNESNQDIQSFYHLHQTYFGMVELKKSQKQAQDDQSMQATKPVVNMHGAIEGGTGGGKVNISTTGGAGVG